MTGHGMDADDTSELLGAYAMGALDDAERAEVDALLGRSAEARLEVARFEHALGALADAQAATSPPAGSWDRLRTALHAEAPQGAPAGGPAATIEAGADLPPLHLPPRQPEDAAGVVVPLRPRRRVPAVLAVAAALVAAGLTVGVVVERQRLHDGGLGRAASAASTASGSLHGQLATADGSVLLPVVVDARGNGYLHADRLPALADGRTYQLWSLDGPAPVSLGLLGNRPGLVTFPTGGQVRTLAVSAERSPGAIAPTAPIASGTLA